MIREEELEIAIKVVIVGNGGRFINFGYAIVKSDFLFCNGCNLGVGKSSMIQRYCKGIYTKDYKKTIGVDFLERMIE